MGSVAFGSEGCLRAVLGLWSVLWWRAVLRVHFAVLSTVVVLGVLGVLIILSALLLLSELRLLLMLVMLAHTVRSRANSSNACRGSIFALVVACCVSVSLGRRIHT